MKKHEGEAKIIGYESLKWYLAGLHDGCKMALQEVDISGFSVFDAVYDTIDTIETQIKETKEGQE